MFCLLVFLWFTNQLSNSKLERGIKAGNVDRNKRNIETSKKHQNFNLTAISYGDMCSVCSYQSENFYVFSGAEVQLYIFVVHVIILLQFIFWR